MKIHHLGLVTKDIDTTLNALGLVSSDITEVVEDHNQMNRLYFIFLKENDMWLELVEPMDETSSVNTFAKKNHVGLHHLAFSGDNLPELKEQLKERPQMYPLGSYEINVKSFGGQIRTLFVAFHGLLLEYVERLQK